jgi:hypothetical protein
MNLRIEILIGGDRRRVVHRRKRRRLQGAYPQTKTEERIVVSPITAAVESNSGVEPNPRTL